METKRLQVIFPRLIYLVQLQLSHFDFRYEFIATIPSPLLMNLWILNNGLIENLDLQEIDAKWPKLRSIKLNSCKNITERIFTLCKFNFLANIQIQNSPQIKISGETSANLRYKKISLVV